MNDRPNFNLALAEDVERVEAKVNLILDLLKNPPAPEWGAIPQAAKHYGKSEDTIRRWIREGTIEARGSGGARQVRLLPR